MLAKRTLTAAETGDIVRATRKAAGSRQDELAGAAGVGRRFVVDLEAGKTTAQSGKGGLADMPCGKRSGSNFR